MQTIASAKMRLSQASLVLAVCSVYLFCISPIGGRCELVAKATEVQTSVNQTIQKKPAQVTNATLTTTDCSCSAEEISTLLQRIVKDDTILRKFLELEEATTSDGKQAINTSLPSDIRLVCMRELIELIRDMAASELEMKTILEFATSSETSPSLSPDLSPQAEGLNKANARSRTERAQRQCDNSKTGERSTIGEQSSNLNSTSSAEDPSGPLQQDDRSRALAKLVSNVDHWILTLERFTLTREWSSLVKIFKGVESILDMFVNKKAQLNATPAAKTEKMAVNSTNANSTSKVQPANRTSSKDDDELLDNLKANLPQQVLTLTNSLNSLFPWHVWPWNNLDLYSTVNTFLNHGIFAFSKTTVGPKRRIDYLHDMLQTLFKSLKFESFPRKCADWSRIICDPLTFHEQLSLGPALEGQESKVERNSMVKELAIKDSKSQLTQELTCIMFSSLSMQHFGASGAQESGQDGAATGNEESSKLKSEPSGALNANNRLPWDRQVHKALKLYSLAREALTDEQWQALYQLSQSLWSEQKISERLIMVGRVVQLLTNCHMPKEMLESALWKDIYKYKNVLNQLLDIVVEELNRSSESGKLTVEQVSFGSAHLHEILHSFIELLPKLVEASARTITEQMPEMVARFFAERGAFFRTPCKGLSFSDLVPELKQYKGQIVAIEDKLCKQLNTKPNITMWQINHLTNEFLAMAFNLSGNFASAGLSLPRMMLNNLNEASAGKLTDMATGTGEQSNATVSIVDEMANNPRLAQIVAILQSSALDPPEVHAELPELDWVEAGTSIALLYESIQKLLSYEATFEIFPEIPTFHKDFNKRLSISKALFKAMSKRDPMRLAAYALDTLMPIALRTFKPMESFSAECQASFRDIFSDQDSAGLYGDVSTAPMANAKGNRQWQCFVSSANFASWAINQFMRNFNDMFRNILAQSGSADILASRNKMAPVASNVNQTKQDTNTCIFLDGSVSLMLDNLPQFIDLALETVLITSTTADEQPVTLYETMCSSNYTLDPFDERSVELRAKMKSKMCHLFHKRSLANCQQTLKFDQWRATMRQLNSTWFESDSLSVNSSFREISLRVHEFLELFGRFKPSTMSDSLLARVLNVNSFWTNLLNRTAKIIDKYQEKRFEYALQTLTPIIYDNLPNLADLESESEPTNLTLRDDRQGAAVKMEESKLSQVRETLMATILAAKAVLNYLDKPGQMEATLISHSNNKTSQQFAVELQRLFAWADQYSILTAESLLRTMADDITRLERIFYDPTQSFASFNNTPQSMLHSHSANLTSLQGNQSMQDTWSRFCAAPIGTYLIIGDPQQVSGSTDSNATSASQPDVVRQMEEGKKEICLFDWRAFYELLNSKETSNEILAEYPERQLTRIALTKWGQVLDVMLIESKRIKQLPKFFYMDYWQQLVRYKLPQISPNKEQPSNLVWIWRGIERLVNAMDAASYSQGSTSSAPSDSDESNDKGTELASKSQISGALQRILDQLNCGLDAVKGGLSWENIANIYSDKHDILAAHNTINNGFALASIGVNTFLVHKKFQRFLDQLVKPGRSGLAAFCEMRDKSQLEAIFSIPTGDTFLQALESFQELICDTNFDTLAQNINPISVCYQIASNSAPGGPNNSEPLADIMDRFFKLASLAVLDAKLVVASDAKPPILDKNQWTNFWSWWAERAEPAPKSGLALVAIRAFQLVDSINANHVVWKALFKSVNEVAEVAAYLFRAVEKRELELSSAGEEAHATGQQNGNEQKLAAGLSLVKEAASQLDFVMRLSNSSSSGANSSQPQADPKQLKQQQQLASTLSNIMFPEVNNFISFRTFKQVRYIKMISDFFALTPGAQASVCQRLHRQTGANESVSSGASEHQQQPFATKIELIGFRLNSNEKLYALMCHYDSSQWLMALNIVLSTRTQSIPRKVGHMTSYLANFARHYSEEERLEQFVHAQQLERIESVTNTSAGYLLAASNSFKSLSFQKIGNISWHSLPNLFDSIDRHLCASKHPSGGFILAKYEPKKPDLETLVCKLPQWNITRVYDYISENFDLQNMISLITTAPAPVNDAQAISLPANNATSNDQSNSTNSRLTDKQLSSIEDGQARLVGRANLRLKTCVTPFKFASRWLKMSQDIADEAMSKSSRAKIRKCLAARRKGQSLSKESLRYVKMINGLLAQIDQLTGSNSWHLIKRGWSSLSYLIINHNGVSFDVAKL